MTPIELLIIAALVTIVASPGLILLAWWLHRRDQRRER